MIHCSLYKLIFYLLDSQSREGVSKFVSMHKSGALGLYGVMLS